jgi:chemotaxis signal transduction protein
MCGSNTSPDRNPEYLLVRSGGKRCAIPIEEAYQVTDVLPLHPLPGSAHRLLGLAQFGGEPVAVVDLQGLLDPDGLPSGGYRLTLIIRRDGGEAPIGLAVEEALGVASVCRDEGSLPDDPPWVAGRGQVDGRSIVLLDPNRLFESEPFR